MRGETHIETIYITQDVFNILETYINYSYYSYDNIKAVFGINYKDSFIDDAIACRSRALEIYKFLKSKSYYNLESIFDHETILKYINLINISNLVSEYDSWLKEIRDEIGRINSKVRMIKNSENDD